MSNIFIIGATGGVGSRLGPMLVKAGHKVIALHRKPDQASDLENAGMTPCHGDIMEMSADDLTDFTMTSAVIILRGTCTKPMEINLILNMKVFDLRGVIQLHLIGWLVTSMVMVGMIWPRHLKRVVC